MKLHEIISPKVVQDMHDLVQKDPTKRIKGVGSGAFVYQNIGDDHSKDEVSRISLAKDPHNLFAWMVKHKTPNNNPYLPRILDVAQGPDGTAHTTMEPLAKMVSVSSGRVVRTDTRMATCDMIIHQAHTWFNEPLASKLIAAVEAVDDDNWKAAMRLCRALDDAFDHPELVADENLKAALATIRQVLNMNRDFVTDFLPGNIMWRITGNIPHLVLSDPLASMK